METGSMLKYVVRSGDRGQVVPLVALALVVLVGAAALAVDVGYWRYQQRLEQSAADSAAIAGANEMIYSTAPADIQRNAQQDATSNGFTDGVAGTTVAVNPAYNPTKYPNGAVEVIVSKTQPAFLANIFGITGQNVSARAVATLSSVGGACVYVMKGSISGNLTLNGGGQGGINTSPLCGLVVNGNLDVTGQANVDASFVSYAGTGPKGGSYPHGQPAKSVAATDPCVRLPGCFYLMNLKSTHPELFDSSTITGTGKCQDPGGVLPAMPLPPGHYCNSNVANGGYTTSPVTLQSGLFIMDKGMFSGAQVSGMGGVTIYNNCSSNCDLTLNGGQVNNSIVAPVTGLPQTGVPPTTGAAGMVYFQPASLTNNITVNGTAGTVQAIGGVYAPGGAFTFNGQLPSISFFVAGTILMNGGGLNAGSSLSGQPQPGNPVLAE